MARLPEDELHFGHVNSEAVIMLMTKFYFTLPTCSIEWLSQVLNPRRMLLHFDWQIAYLPFATLTVLSHLVKWVLFPH